MIEGLNFIKDILLEESKQKNKILRLTIIDELRSPRLAILIIFNPNSRYESIHIDSHIQI